MAQGGNGVGPVKDGDKILGNWRDDLLVGTNLAEEIYGKGGNDTLIGLGGGDLLDGGDGIDTASYADSPAGVTVNLATGTGLGGDAEGDTLIGIENLIGSAYDDTLTGDGGANTLAGGDGNDLLEGGAGTELLDGGNGTDTASYAGSSAGVTVNLFTGSAAGGDAEGDTLVSIENLTGSVHDDTLTGDSGDNVLVGGAGNDVLRGDADAGPFGAGGGDDILDGGAGDDVLEGGDGNDVLEGGGGNDQLTDGSGNNVLDGGAGDDILTVGGFSFDILTGGSGADIFAINFPLFVPAGASATTTITDFTIGEDKVYFTNGFDVFANAVQDGADVRISMAMNFDLVLIDTQLADLSDSDFLFGNPDTIIGTSGDDVLSGSGAPDVIRGLAGNDILSGAGGDDLLDGGAGDDQLMGGDGNDTLLALDGNDNLDGGAGDDLLDMTSFAMHAATGGSGADTFFYRNALDTAVDDGNGTLDLVTTITDFQPGIDVIAFDAQPFDVLSLAQQDGADVLIVFDAEKAIRLVNTQLADLSSGDFSFVGVNVIIGTEFTDFLLGTSLNDEIHALGGDDYLAGFAGDDLLYGEAGNDRLFGDPGADLLDGGSGVDIATYQLSTSGVVGSLATGLGTGGDAAGDVYVSIENMIGSNYDDTLEGDDNANTLQGLGGDNVLSGGGGDDALLGGAGSDLLDGGTGDDLMMGGAGNDTLMGGDGNDFLIGGIGDDLMTGGAGADVFGIHISTTAAPPFLSLDGFGTDTITDFEVGVDTIRIDWTEFDILSLAVQSGSDVVINYATGSTLILQNTDLADLSASDFVFDAPPIEDPFLI